MTIKTLEDGTQIWYYTRDGITVPYIPKVINGKLQNVIQFPKAYLHSDKHIACFKVDGFTGNRKFDKQLALKYLRFEGYYEIPDGYVYNIKKTEKYM